MILPAIKSVCTAVTGEVPWKRIFHVDPLICPCCKEEMIPVYYVFDGKTVRDPPSKRRRKADIPIPHSWE